MDESNTMRTVILGKSGAGKSSLANTIFGEQLFTINHSLNSGTGECRAETRNVNGRSITLIDTPGLFDTDRSEEKLKSEIVSCITECAPGPHAFLIVLKVEIFTKQEQEVITKIKQYFSEEVFRYATVLFTHGDQLPEGQKIDLVQKNKSMRDLVKKCGGRCHVIDNKYWDRNTGDEYRSNQFQVKALLETLDKMVMENNRRCYTNELLQAAQQIINQEEGRIRQSPGNMSETEIRGEAKKKASTSLLVRLAGVGTGVLLGAFFGVIVMGGLAVTALQLIVNVQNLAIRAAAGGVAGAAAGGVAGAAAGGVGEAAAGGVAAAAGGVGEAAAGGVAAAAGGVAGAAGGGVGEAAAVQTGVRVARLSLRTAVGVSAVVGGVAGGVTGYYAAEGAETPLEAIKKTAEAVTNGALSILNFTSK